MSFPPESRQGPRWQLLASLIQASPQALSFQAAPLASLAPWAGLVHLAPWSPRACKRSKPRIPLLMPGGNSTLQHLPPWQSNISSQAEEHQIQRQAYVQSVMVRVADPASPLASASRFEGLTRPPPGPFQTTLNKETTAAIHFWHHQFVQCIIITSSFEKDHWCIFTSHHQITTKLLWYDHNFLWKGSASFYWRFTDLTIINTKNRMNSLVPILSAMVKILKDWDINIMCYCQWRPQCIYEWHRTHYKSFCMSEKLSVG